MSGPTIPVKSGLLVGIRSVLPSLNEQEQEVGRYVLDHPEEVVHLSMAELAERSGSSDATVFRFCKKVIGGGYQEFKIRLAKELGAANSSVYVPVAREDSLVAAAAKIVAADVKALQDTLSMLDLETLHRAMDALQAAQRVHIYGSGGAAVAAMEMEYKLIRVGVSAVAQTDAKMQLISASLLVDSDVAVGISHSGESVEVLRSMAVARQTGASLIAITNHPGSALGQLVDITLSTSAQEGSGRGYPLGARVAQIALIDVLYGCLAQRRGDETERSLERIAQAVYSHPFGRA
jgi:RpiR family transcriptional regulator, carbohydrate utilization regulator